MDIKIPENVKSLLDKLEENGFEAYVVGGCVRDSLLCRTPNDWDITTSALPEEVEEVFHDKQIIETGLQHGTVTIMDHKEGFEITTFRIDGDYNDGRHPDSVRFTSNIEEDLARRDFTINAMAYSPKRGFIDPYHGREDIKNKLIRCVGEPEDRFNEDALRILRAIRFACQLDFSIETNTDRCINEWFIYQNLNTISGERKQKELMNMIATKSFPDQLEEHPEVFATILPDFIYTINFDQKNKYHCYDVFYHIAESIRECESDDKITKLALLLHDIGKPFSCQETSEGRHFVGHADVSAEKAENILRNLRFDKNTIDKVCELVKYHDIYMMPRNKIVKHRLNRFGEEQFARLLDMRIADIKAQNPELIDRVEAIYETKQLTKEILEKQPCLTKKDLAVTGSDLMKIGYPAGPELGKKLDDILEKVLNDELENDKYKILVYANDVIDLRRAQAVDLLVKHGISRKNIDIDKRGEIHVKSSNQSYVMNAFFGTLVYEPNEPDTNLYTAILSDDPAFSIVHDVLNELSEKPTPKKIRIIER